MREGKAGAQGGAARKQAMQGWLRAGTGVCCSHMAAERVSSLGLGHLLSLPFISFWGLRAIKDSILHCPLLRYKY